MSIQMQATDLKNTQKLTLPEKYGMWLWLLMAPVSGSEALFNVEDFDSKVDSSAIHTREDSLLAISTDLPRPPSLFPLYGDDTLSLYGGEPYGRASSVATFAPAMRWNATPSLFGGFSYNDNMRVDPPPFYSNPSMDAASDTLSLGGFSNIPRSDNMPNEKVTPCNGVLEKRLDLTSLPLFLNMPSATVPKKAKKAKKTKVPSQRGSETKRKVVNGGERPFACSRCDKAFKQKSNLTQHISGVHEGNRPFTCATCGKGFKQKSNLTQHISGVHGGNRP